MLNFEIIFSAAFYLSKMLRLSIMVGIFEALERNLLWILRPVNRPVKMTKLQKAGVDKNGRGRR